MPLIFQKCDITRMKVDAVVNAANESLLGGGGVDGAIHRAAGPELLEECRALHGCETGQAKLTGGYRMPCRYIIHTVGPIYRDGRHGEPELLAACYRNSLQLAWENACETVAFPAISTGVYGYPKEDAKKIAVETVSEFLQEHEMTVYLVFLNVRPKADERLERYIAEHSLSAAGNAAYPVYDAERADRKKEKSAGGLFGLRARKSSAARRDAAEPLCDVARREEVECKCDLACEDTVEYECSEVPDFRSMLDESFTEMLLRKITESGMTDAECYRKANVDRKLFSKIRSDAHYRPKKATAFAFAIALRLGIAETEELLGKAGYAFAGSSLFDVIIRYYIENGEYNINTINETLFQYDQVLLGV